MIGTRKSGLKALIFVALAAVLTAGLPGKAQAQEDRTAQVEALFREGLDLYQQGRYSEAQMKLKEVLRLEPRKELAARLVDEAGTRIMAKMMADVRMGNEPAYIWQLYRKYYVAKLADGERTTALVKRLVNPMTAEDERNLIYRELAQLGHYAIPFLVPYLQDEAHEDFHTYARIAIAQMGSRAVLPMVALLNHPRELVRRHAVLILGDLQPADPRAIPALKARLEDQNETETVKTWAARTLRRITGLEATALKNAPAYYYELANRYYLDRAGVAEEAEDVDGMIWHVNPNGELAVVQYPLWAWNEQMAEEVLLAGMAQFPEYTDYYPLWACLQAAQFTEVKDLLDILTEQPGEHSFSLEEQQEIRDWDTKLVNARRLAAAVGKEYCNAALAKVHADLSRYPGHRRVPQVGVFLARLLARLDPTGELLTAPPEPLLTAELPAGNRKQGAAQPIDVWLRPVVSESALVAGLDSADQSIQYACAHALARINRFPAKWIGQEKVARLLGRGIGEDKPLHILVVEENANAAKALRSRLDELGFNVSVAETGRDALMTAKAFPPKDIAIISDSLRRDLTSDQLLEELRADVRTRYMPCGVLHAGQDRDITKSRFGTQISLVERENAGHDLKLAVENIAAQRAAESVPKRKAHEVAVECAAVLAEIKLESTHLTLGDATESAILALVNRPDDVRIPAAVFLGQTAGGSQQEKAAGNLLAVVLDQNNNVELRRTALKSLGRVQPKGLESVYVQLQSDSDQEIRDLAAEAFGHISRPNQAISDFVQRERIDKAKKEK